MSTSSIANHNKISFYNYKIINYKHLQYVYPFTVIIVIRIPFHRNNSYHRFLLIFDNPHAHFILALHCQLFFNMTSSSKHKLMFFILLSLQLSAILSQNINGISMALHTKMKMKSESTKNEPLYYPSDFIEYYIKLSVGTPAQDLLLVMDTGSNVVWAPCTTNYTCNNCHGYSTVFLPSKSSSAVPVQCADPK
jgi:hypothetical protein